MDPPCRESFHDLGMVDMISWMEIYEPWLKNWKRAVPIAKTDFKNDGYGPIANKSENEKQKRTIRYLMLPFHPFVFIKHFFFEGIELASKQRCGSLIVH